MNRNYTDGVFPSVGRIRQHLDGGDYGHDVENTIRALINEIDRLQSANDSLSRQLDQSMNRLYDH